MNLWVGLLRLWEKANIDHIPILNERYLTSGWNCGMSKFKARQTHSHHEPKIESDRFQIKISDNSLETRLDLRHLRYFRAVAEELSFKRASERLHIAQPPLSQQIKQLENDLGVLLLDRTHRPLRLTDAGEHFLQCARDVLSKVNSSVEDVRRIGRGLSGKIDIGFAGSAMYDLLPRIIILFRDRYPDIELVFREMLAGEINAALETHQIDVGFSRPGIDSSESLEQILLVNEPLVVAVSDRHPSANSGVLRIDQLNGEDVILYPRHPIPSLTDHIFNSLKTSSTQISVVKEVSNIQTALGLVAANVGITFVPASVGEHTRSGIKYLTLEPQVLFSPMTAVWHRARSTMALQRLLEVAKELI
jgi:DNA-binding transcriptional LysR family regulator